MVLFSAVLRQFWVTAESTQGAGLISAFFVHNVREDSMPHVETGSSISYDVLTHSMNSSRTRNCDDGQKFPEQMGNFPCTHILRMM